MEGFFAALKAFFDKRQQEMILLLGIAEESADVPMRAQLRAGEANRIFFLSTSDVHDGVLSVLEWLCSLTKNPFSVRQPAIDLVSSMTECPPRSLRVILTFGPGSPEREMAHDNG